MHARDTILLPVRNHPAGPSAQPATCSLLRLHTPSDADSLGEQLDRLSRQLCGGSRAAAPVALSVVETCGRSPAERERDALRLIDAEAGSPCAASPRQALRATLVSIAPDEHLLLLAAPPDDRLARLLSRLVEELTRLYPAAAPQPA